MIAISCSACQKKLTVKEHLAGKKVKCPGCGKVVAVPDAVAVTPPGLDELRTVPPTDSPRKHADADDVMEQKTILPAPAETETAVGVKKPGDHGATQARPPKDTDADQDGDSDLWDFLAPPELPDEIGRLGPYRVLKVLGAGGMGVVFKAEDPQLQRIVALKAMLPAMANSGSAKKRFLREARAAAALKHDHIVAIYQVGEDRGAPYLAMEFLHGEPLDERLKRDEILPIAEVLQIGRQVAEGLAAAHEHGLMHRDIKPANVWLEFKKKGEEHAVTADKKAHDKKKATALSGIAAPKVRAKILDFGLARAASEETQLTQSGAIVGTPAYMAPEQACGGKVDHRCDLFSFGVMLYRMAAGELPFKGKDAISILSSLALETPREPSELNPDIPAGLNDLIMQLLAKKPGDRPESAQTVVEALTALEAGEKPDVPRYQAKSGRSKLLLAGAAGVVCLAGLACVVLSAGFFIFGLNRPAPLDNKKGIEEPVAKEPAKKFNAEWVQLFNGKDLTGWKVFPGEPEAWKVVDGNLEVVGPPPKSKEKSRPGCLFTERSDFENFHLRMEVYIWSTANRFTNGAIFFRSKFGPGISHSGYKIVTNGDQGSEVTGTLSGFVSVKKSLRMADQWFTMDIIARGNHLVIKVNGKTAVDFIDKEYSFKVGHLALQYVSGAGIKYRKIEIRELPPGPGPFPDDPDPKAEEPGWTPLVAGNDRTTWRVGYVGKWELKDGVVSGITTNGNSILSLNNLKFKDFELKFQVKLKSGKPAFWFRNGVDTQIRFTYGPFVDLGSGTWGGLYDNAGVAVKILKAADFQQVQKVIKLDDFNDVHVKCVGKHCTIQVNGLVTVDDDFPGIPDEGQIGLALYGGGEADFRNLFVRDLNAQKK